MSSKKMNHDKILDLAVSKAFTKEDMNAFLMNLRLYKNSNSKERSRISSKTFQDLNIHNNKIKITDVTDQYRKLLSRYKNGNLRNVLTPYWVSILYPPNQPSSQQTQIQQEQPQTTQSSQLQTDQQIQLNQPIQPQNFQSNLIQQSQIDKPFQFQAIQPTQQSLTQNYQTTQQNNNNNNENQSINSSNDKEIEPNQIESQQNQENSQDLNLQNNQQQIQLMQQNQENSQDLNLQDNQQQIQLMQQNQPIQTQQFQLNTTQNFYQQQQQQLQEMQPIHFQLNQTNYQQHQNSQTAQNMDTMQQFQIQSNQNSEDKQKLDEEAKKMENENLNSEKIQIQQNGQNQNESQQESQNSEEIKQKKKDKNTQIDSNQQDKDVQEIQNKSQNNENSKEKQNSDENESDDCPFKLLYKFPSPSMQRYQMTCNYQKMYQQLLNSQYQSMQQYQTMQNYQMMQHPQSVYSQQYQMVQQGQPQQQQSQQASQSTQSQQQQDQANSLYQVQQQQQNAQSVQQPQTMQTFQYNQPQAVQSQQIQTQQLQTMQSDQSQSVYTYPQQLQMMQQYGYQQQQLQSQQQPYSQQIIQQSNETEQQQAVTNSQSQQSPQFQQSYQTYQYQPYVSAQQYQYQPNSTMYQYNYQQPQQAVSLYQSTPQTENYYGQEMQQQPLQTVNLYQSTPQTENDLNQEVLLQPQQQQTVNLYQSTPQTENDLNQEVQQQQQKISQNPSKMQPNQVNQNNSSSPSANPIINVVDSDSSGLEASNSKSCEPSSLACSSPQYQEKYHPDDLDQLEFNNSPSLSTNHDQILYKEIKNYFKTLHNSPPSEENDNQIEINEDKIRYQNEIESKFLQIIKTFHTKLNKYSIRFIDKKVEVISPKMKSFPKTKITRECNTNILYNPNSKEFIDQHNEDHLLKSDIDITLYTKTTEIRNFNLNEKLITFFLGEFQDDSCCSYKIDNIEVSTVVSYKFTNSNEIDHMKGEFLFCQPAYVYFVQEEKKHVLNFFGIEVDTQFIFPAKAMIFHRESNINKLYIRGDIRVIEFTINGLDEYIQISFKNGFNHPVFWNNEFDPGGEIKRQMISIVETGTYFYEDFEYKKSVISVWNDELVLGINNLLVFWKIEGKKESSHQSKIEIENIQMITSLQIIDKKDLNSYLAVASEIYPVISILNKEHQIVSKLISHTLGVTSLNSYGFRLFSGSFDNTVNVWDLNKSLPLSLFHIASNEITAIETGTFCDHLFLFMGTKNHNVYCWSVTLKKILFEINLNENTIPKKIVFMSASNNENGDFCKLMVISEFEDPTIQNIFKTNEVQYFEFM